MTKENLITGLKHLAITMERNGDSSFQHIAEDAIKALEQKPCEDCISREKTCDYIAEFVNNEYSTQSECEMVDAMIEGIQHLPSVQPKAEIGHWICLEDEYGDVVDAVCSKCGGNGNTDYMHYCPNCGAKMKK